MDSKTMKLTASRIDTALREMPGWSYDGTALRWERVFPDFATAFSFMTRVALRAEKAGHHPDWSNSYGTVKIALSTHDAGGVTEKDLALAREIEAIAG